MAATNLASGQAQVNFANKVIGIVDAPVYFADCRTPVRGFQFQAQLLAGIRGAEPANLVPVGPTRPFYETPEIAAGYWIPTVVEIPFIPHDSWGVLQVRVWEADAGSFEEAVLMGRPYGVSKPLEIFLQHPGLTGTAVSMRGLEGFCLVPEPEIMRIGLLGGLVLWAWRRDATRRTLKSGIAVRGMKSAATGIRLHL